MARRDFSFNSTRQRLLDFKQAMLRVDPDPYQLGWESVCECLEFCEMRASEKEEIDTEMTLARFQRLIRICLSEDIDSLPDVVPVTTGHTPWPEGSLREFIARVGGSRSMQTSQTMLQSLAQEVLNLPEASWLQTARNGLRTMEEIHRGLSAQ